MFPGEGRGPGFEGVVREVWTPAFAGEQRFVAYRLPLLSPAVARRAKPAASMLL